MRRIIEIANFQVKLIATRLIATTFRIAQLRGSFLQEHFRLTFFCAIKFRESFT